MTVTNNFHCSRYVVLKLQTKRCKQVLEILLCLSNSDMFKNKNFIHVIKIIFQTSLK